MTRADLLASASFDALIARLAPPRIHVFAVCSEPSPLPSYVEPGDLLILAPHASPSDSRDRWMAWKRAGGGEDWRVTV